MTEKTKEMTAVPPAVEKSEDLNMDEAVESAEVLKGLLGGDLFKSFEVSNFEVLLGDGSHSEGESFEFEVNLQTLKQVTNMLRVTSGSQHAVFGNVKITLLNDKMIKLATFDRTAFSEIVIPMTLKGGTLEGPTHFIFSHLLLSKIVSNFKSETISFVLDTSKHTISVCSQGVSLNLSLKSEIDFMDYHKKLKTPDTVKAIKPVNLASGLRFLNLSSEKGTLQPEFSVLQVEPKRIYGGCESVLGFFNGEICEDQKFSLKLEVLKTLEYLCKFLDANEAVICDMGNFFIIRDKNIFIGFEKTENNFPNVDQLLELAKMDLVLKVDRAVLAEDLKKLSIVSQDKDLVVTCSVAKSKPNELKISVKDRAGKVSTASLPVEASCEVPSKYQIHLNLQLFAKLVEFYSVDTLEIKAIQSEGLVKAWILEDSGLEDQMTSVLSAMEL